MNKRDGVFPHPALVFYENCGSLERLKKADLVVEGIDELIEICTRIFREPKWARQIREAGQKRTLAEHTFDQRVKILEQLWA